MSETHPDLAVLDEEQFATVLLIGVAVMVNNPFLAPKLRYCPAKAISPILILMYTVLGYSSLELEGVYFECLIFVADLYTSLDYLPSTWADVHSEHSEDAAVTPQCRILSGLKSFYTQSLVCMAACEIVQHCSHLLLLIISGALRPDENIWLKRNRICILILVGSNSGNALMVCIISSI